jgi:serine protease Do
LATIGGAVIGSFDPENDSPAKRAGAEIGDIIVAAGGHAIDQPSTLQRVVRGYKPGDVVDVDVVRPGSGKRTLHVKLGEPAPEATAVAANDEPSSPSSNDDAGKQNDKLGITVAPISTEFAQQAKLASTYRNGIVVTKVAPSGASFRSLVPNDVILSELVPTARPIRSLEDLQSAAAALKGGDVIELKVCNPDPTTATCQTRVVSIEVRR